MNRKITLGGAITLAIMLSTVTFIITMIYAKNTFDGKVYDVVEREQMYSKLSEVDTTVRREFLGEIDEVSLQDSMIRGYVAGLEDVNSLYFTAEEYATLMSSHDETLVDIGIAAHSLDPSGYIQVLQVAEDSASSVAGINVGDLIIKVDDLDVTAKTYDDAVDALRGEAGTVVDLSVRRGGVEKTYTVTRRRLEVLSASHDIFENIGYIKITEFNDNTVEQFERSLKALLDEDVGGIVFDVRSNPGGTLPSVSSILDTLLPMGPIVSSTNRAGETNVLYESDANEISLPMAVLINGKSASASELFAQSLKDYDKASLVGSKTFGKGSMQYMFPLNDGSALDITIALFNPPFSENFDGIGVKPDFEVSIPADLEAQLDMLDETTDIQLQKALEVVSAKIKSDIEVVVPIEPVVSDPLVEEYDQLEDEINFIQDKINASDDADELDALSEELVVLKTKQSDVQDKINNAKSNEPN